MNMDKENIRIVFMGTSEISSYVLENLINNKFNVVGVVSQPDKEVGRKKIITPTPCKLIANKYGIPCFQPIRIKKEFEFIKDLNCDIIVTFAYGQIIPQELLDMPTIGSINLHGSILPKYRGAAPVQWALINGETKTGVTLMEMTYKMDAGRMYAKKYVDISVEDNATTLFEKIKKCASDLILEYLPLYAEGKLKGEEQNEAEVSFARMIKSEDEKLLLNYDSSTFVNWVRGLSDVPGGYLLLDNQKLIIYKAKISNQNFSGKIGEIVNADKNSLTIALKDGCVDILELKLQGKNRCDYKSFVNGHKNLKGKILS